MSRLIKSAICKAREPEKGEAYFMYVESFPGEAQRRRSRFWTA